MQVDPQILTLAYGLLAIFVMLMGLMFQLLRRLDRVTGSVEANTAAINSLDAKIDTRTAELHAKIDTRTAELHAKIDTRTAELHAKIDTRTAELHAKVNSLAAAMLAGFEVNRERIDLNRERIEDNRTRIDSCMAYLREFRIETRENFELIMDRIAKLDDEKSDTR